MPVPLRKIRLSFPATGESAIAQLMDEEAPMVCQQIWDRLPVEHKAIHGQVSGPEVFVLLSDRSRYQRNKWCNCPYLVRFSISSIQGEA